MDAKGKIFFFVVIKHNINHAQHKPNSNVICEAEEKLEKQSLDDYEADERFTLEFVTVKQVLNVNNNHDHGEKVNAQTFRGMLDRENRVLEFVENEIINR